jgi:threonine synthase
VAGLLKAARAGEELAGRKVVCVITGSGLKDPERAIDEFALELAPLPADIESIERAMGWNRSSP